MIDKLVFYFQYPFVRYALIVGVLIALCSSLLGVTLVLKRFSFIGDGLSHVAFGAMAVASVLNLTNNMLFILPVTVLCAILLLRTGQNTKIKGDAAIAMISVGALAIGYLLMNIFSTGPNLSGDVCSTLFGSTSILTITSEQVKLCGVLSVIVVVLFIMFYNKIFCVTFDETFAKATGMKTQIYNLIIALITAVIIVLAMNLVGSLLISALIIFPALSAMRIFKTFFSVTVCSVIISVICAMSGIVMSILAGTPVGSTIVATDIAAFLSAVLLEKQQGEYDYEKIKNIDCMCRNTSCYRLFKNVHTGKSTAGNSVNNVINSQIAESSEAQSIKAFSTDLVKSKNSYDSADYDLTTMSGDMVYATVYQMMTNPDKYVGKVFKMDGTFYSSYYNSTDKYYHYCIIQDATACCAQGMEFVWDDDSHVYPDDYPAENSNIVVTGVFETYREDGDKNLYCRLSDASLELDN